MIQERKGDWFQTASGHRFWPMDPRVEDISLYDIAHALSNVCRFGGHCRVFYSVAQHSMHVSSMVSQDLAMQALLHDATEAYLGDMVRPLKNSMPEYRAVEARLWQVIAKRFLLQPEMHPDVKWADNRALLTERCDIVLNTPYRWSIEGFADEAKIKPMAPGEARQAFLERYWVLEAFRKGAA